MNIIILTEQDRIDSNKFLINDGRSDHILTILKAKVSDTIEIGLLNDKIGKGSIVSIDNSNIEIEIGDLNFPKNNIQELNLICALPRPQTLKKILNISATMGVKHIYLIRSEKVEKSYFHSPLLEQPNYNRFLIEGLSQGKRIDLPTVSIHKRFKEFFSNYVFDSENEIGLFAHPNDSDFLNSKLIGSKQTINFAIGPEGGWNDYEIKFMQEKGFHKFNLSKNILRVESAVTSTLAQIELIQSTY